MRSRSDKNHPIITILAKFFVFLNLFMIIGFMCLWYTSVDARYLRDNYQYMTERYAELGIGEPVNTHGIHALRWPLPASLAGLYQMENEWTKMYIDLGMPDNNVNPWDTVSRLQLSANSPYVQAVYDSITWDLAFFQDNNLQKKEMQQAWVSDRNNYQENAQLALKSLLMQYEATLYLGGMALVLGGVSAIYLLFFSKDFRHIRNGLTKVLKRRRNK